MTPAEARTKLREIAEARAYETTAILNAIEAGVRQADIVRDTGRTREYIRRVARDNGITPEQDPT